MKKQLSWLKKPLGAILDDIGDGGTPDTNKKEYFGGNIPWVVIQDIKNEISDTRIKITKIGLDACSAKLWPTGTVILSTGATIGEVGIAKIPLCTKQGIHGLVCGDEIESQFLFYKIQTLRDYLKANAQGSTIREVRAPFIKTIDIEFPSSKSEQSKIAEVLTKVDQAIEQTEQQIAKQQRIKTGLMQDLLSRGIDEHGNLRSEETHEFKDSPLGRIPVEWEVHKIEKFASLQRGYDITEEQLCDGPFPVVASSGIVGYHSKSTSHGPNVVVGRKGTIGKVHYILGDFWAHDTSLNVTNFWGNHEKFIYYLFSYLDLARFGTKSGSPSLNRNDIHPLWVGRPSVSEQAEISKMLDKIELKRTGTEKHLFKLRSLKTALMQDLLTGKVRVTPLMENMETTT